VFLGKPLINTSFFSCYWSMKSATFSGKSLLLATIPEVVNSTLVNNFFNRLNSAAHMIYLYVYASGSYSLPTKGG